MTMPSISDVKAAAENIAASGAEFLSDPQSRDASILARFALSVLNAPGLSAERLAEIHRLEQEATAGPWWFVDHNGAIRGVGNMIDGIGRLNEKADTMYAADARQAVPELLAEVLRLRAGVTLPCGGDVS